MAYFQEPLRWITQGQVERIGDAIAAGLAIFIGLGVAYIAHRVNKNGHLLKGQIQQHDSERQEKSDAESVETERAAVGHDVVRCAVCGLRAQGVDYPQSGPRDDARRLRDDSPDPMRPAEGFARDEDAYDEHKGAI